MMSAYEDRKQAIVGSPLETGPAAEHGGFHPVTEALGEYYRRMARFESPIRTRIPPSPDDILAAFPGALAPADISRVEHDANELFVAFSNRHISPSVTRLFRAILLWSLLVDRGKLVLEDDPSVPLLRIFAAGYTLKEDGHTGGLEIWGEVPWTIYPGDVLRRAGLWKD